MYGCSRMPYETIDIPLSSGLNTKSDAKALAPPGLLVAQDVQFDDIGGLQTRPQFQTITDHVSNTIADIRKIVEYGDELVAFTKDELWSYASGDGLWTKRSDYLAVKVDEVSRFVTTGDQYDCDRAELGGVTMFCWSEDTPGSTVAYIAAIDTATGAIKKSPTALTASEGRPKLLAGSTRIYLITYDSGAGTLDCRAYDPADLSTDVDTVAASGLVGYDAMINPADSTEVLAVAARGTSYDVISFQADATGAVEYSRTITIDGAVAFSASSLGIYAICYSAGTAIKADVIDDTYTPITNDAAVGTAFSATVNQIAAEHDGTEFYVFWSAGETSLGSSAFNVEFNTLSDAGSPATESQLVGKCGLASRAFVHDSSVYIWVVFAGESAGEITAQIQNTYFLLRSDGEIAAKSVPNQAGGFSASTGYLPNVQDVGSGAWSWCGQYRRVIPLGDGSKGYAAKSPQDVTFTFDSNDARRTARLGETLYISGGIFSQYDGQGVYEVGFHTFPWNLSIVATTGSNLSGTYNWQQTYSWYGATGEFERSTTATIYSQVMATHEADIVGQNLMITAKSGVAAEFWRQEADAALAAPFYLVTSKDPAATGDNGYVENDPTAGIMATFSDDLADSVLVAREPYPENGGLTLENLSPPAASIVVATQDRLILAGIAGHPNRMQYSKLRGEGEIAAFHDSLYVDLPRGGGDNTAIGFINETMVVFQESAIYVLPGDGFDNSGGGQNYGPARKLPTDVGAIDQESVGSTPEGLLFKSSKGWHMLDNGLGVTYVGYGVDEFDDEEVISVESMNSQHQVRCMTDSRVLVWDTIVNEWSEWSLVSIGSSMWDDTYHVIGSGEATVLAQASSYSGAGDLPQLDIETAWIKVDGLQGYGLIRRLFLLGEYLGAHDLRVRVAYDYDDSWIDDKAWTVSPTTIGGPLQIEHGLSRPKCQSVKFRLTAQAVGATTAPITQALNLTGMSLEVKLKNNNFGKAMGKSQKQ